MRRVCHKMTAGHRLPCASEEVLSCVITVWVIRWFQRSQTQLQPSLSFFSLSLCSVIFFKDKDLCPCILSLPVIYWTCHSNYSSCSTFSDLHINLYMWLAFEFGFFSVFSSKINLSFGISLYDIVGTNCICITANVHRLLIMVLD